jgi:hypothetical protein
VNEQKPLKIIPMSNETGTSLLHQLKDHPCKEFPKLLLESMHHRNLDAFVRPKCRPFSTFLRGLNTWKPQSDKSKLNEEWTNTIQHI